MKGRPSQEPDENDKQRAGKSPGAPEHGRRMPRENTKGVAHDAKQIALFFVLLELFNLGLVCHVTLGSHPTWRLRAQHRQPLAGAGSLPRLLLLALPFRLSPSKAAERRCNP